MFLEEHDWFLELNLKPKISGYSHPVKKLIFHVIETKTQN